MASRRPLLSSVAWSVVAFTIGWSGVCRASIGFPGITETSPLTVRFGSYVRDLEYSSLNGNLVVRTSDGTYVVNTTTGKKKLIGPSFLSRIAPDGRKLALLSFRFGHEASLLTISDSIGVFRKQSRRIPFVSNSVAFSPDSNHIAWNCKDSQARIGSTVAVWDLPANKIRYLKQWTRDLKLALPAQYSFMNSRLLDWQAGSIIAALEFSKPTGNRRELTTLICQIDPKSGGLVGKLRDVSYYGLVCRKGSIFYITNQNGVRSDTNTCVYELKLSNGLRRKVFELNGQLEADDDNPSLALPIRSSSMVLYDTSRAILIDMAHKTKTKELMIPARKFGGGRAISNNAHVSGKSPVNVMAVSSRGDRISLTYKDSPRLVVLEVPVRQINKIRVSGKQVVPSRQAVP